MDSLTLVQGSLPAALSEQRISRLVDGDLLAASSDQRTSWLVDVDLLDYPFDKERLADVHFLPLLFMIEHIRYVGVAFPSDFDLKTHNFSSDWRMSSWK
jgi:hypothetical protein